jgi:large subunit ribosomal protein L10
MSKYVKNLLTEHLRGQLRGVDDVLVVNMVGMDATRDNRLRKELRSRNIRVMVVKNSLARRAVGGTRLAPAFEGLSGPAAICWGGDDLVSLAKEIVKLARDPRFAPFAPCGGVMDGEGLTAAQVEQLSRWPSRQELLSIVAGQLLGVASEVVGQLVGPAMQVASQIEKLIENKRGGEDKPKHSQEESSDPVAPVA